MLLTYIYMYLFSPVSKAQSSTQIFLKLQSLWRRNTSATRLFPSAAADSSTLWNDSQRHFWYPKEKIWNCLLDPSVSLQKYVKSVSPRGTSVSSQWLCPHGAPAVDWLLSSHWLSLSATWCDVMCDATSALFFCHLEVGSVGPSEEAFLFFFSASLSGHDNFACQGVFLIWQRKEPRLSYAIFHLSYTSSEIRVKWRNMSRILWLVSGALPLPSVLVEFLLTEMIFNKLKISSSPKKHAFFSTLTYSCKYYKSENKPQFFCAHPPLPVALPFSAAYCELGTGDVTKLMNYTKM